MNTDSDYYELIYFADDDYNVYCEFCDKLCIERYYENHLKSVTHTNSNRKRQKIFH